MTCKSQYAAPRDKEDVSVNEATNKHTSIQVYDMSHSNGKHRLRLPDKLIFISEGFVVSTFRQTLRLTTLKIYY